MGEKIRWGILGPGRIARRFSRCMPYAHDAELTAVGSRSEERAKAFAEEFDVPKTHASYEELVQDPDVDIIYVGTPHPFHKEQTIMALEEGKPVLCEKPFAVNQHEAREMVDCGRKNNLSLWTRCGLAFFRLWRKYART